MDEKEESVENQTKKENGKTHAYNQLNEKQLETLDSNKIEVQAKTTTLEQLAQHKFHIENAINITNILLLVVFRM